jgi:hypothetical protein
VLCASDSSAQTVEECVWVPHDADVTPPQRDGDDGQRAVATPHDRTMEAIQLVRDESRSFGSEEAREEIARHHLPWTTTNTHSDAEAANFEEIATTKKVSEKIGDVKNMGTKVLPKVLLIFYVFCDRKREKLNEKR